MHKATTLSNSDSESDTKMSVRNIFHLLNSTKNQVEHCLAVLPCAKSDDFVWVIREWTSGLKAALEWLNHLLQPIIQQRSCDGDKACRFSLCQPNSVYLLRLCLFFHFYSIFFSSRGERAGHAYTVKTVLQTETQMGKVCASSFFSLQNISYQSLVFFFTIYVRSIKNEIQ